LIDFLIEQKFLNYNQTGSCSACTLLHIKFNDNFECNKKKYTVAYKSTTDLIDRLINIQLPTI